MANLNAYAAPAQMLENEDNEQEYSLVAELAWEYCKKIRHGENPSKNEYYGRLKDAGDKEEFDLLVGMNEFIEQVVEHQVQVASTSP